MEGKDALRVVRVFQYHVRATKTPVSRTSATNCAQIYNETIGGRDELGRFDSWAGSFKLKTEHVWDAFIILSLLDWHSSSLQTRLVVPNTGPQSERFIPAMRERNEHIVYHGQPEWNHACDKCVATSKPGVRMSQDPSRTSISSAVISAVILMFFPSVPVYDAIVVDGVTLGRPCCAVHDCHEDLPSNRDRFCKTHADLHQQCAVEGCENSVAAANRMTCSLEDHKTLEDQHHARGQAMFQLKRLIERRTVSNPENAAPELSDTNMPYEYSEEIEMATDKTACDGKDEKGNTRIKARFTRRRTHNEQLFVRGCGVIPARATFNGSEAISAVKVSRAVVCLYSLSSLLTQMIQDMILAKYSIPGSMPNYIFYDNNCNLLRHIKNCPSEVQERFKNTRLPVDVFHFKCKHKTTDELCQTACNPAAFPELTVDGKWTFNSSAAEQANVWAGGYHAILREMGSVKYSFFLDEMILCKNRVTVAKLRKAGFVPHLRPFPSTM